jgi:predicted MFS family arabinose efflux permease
MALRKPPAQHCVADDRKRALAFVIAIGFVSLFADAAYEGMRGISGPFLLSLGASAALVGVIAGGGELVGYLLRLVSGRWAGASGAYWPIALGGYVLQMAVVPLLAFAPNWPMAALLIVLERAGKAIRNPPRDTMLSRAGTHLGQGWAFGLHEAMDKTGALAGPLIAAFVLARHGDFRAAFLWLGIPAALTLLAALSARLRFAPMGAIPARAAHAAADRLPRAFWWYAAAAALVGFGFADYPLIAFHFAKARVMPLTMIPVLYGIALGASGVSGIAFGRWFDGAGLRVLLPGLVLGVPVAPLVFLGGQTAALAGTLLWGLSLGVHTAVMNAAIAGLVPENRRAAAFGIFSAIFGIAWFLGSAAMGLLYDQSRTAVAALSVTAALLAFIPLRRAMREG